MIISYRLRSKSISSQIIRLEVSMNLLDLPREILAEIPFHLRNIQDFTDASSSCRSLYTAFAHAPPNVILRLAAASSRELFCPHPHYLVAATVRQVSEWARLRPQNTAILQETFENGIDALFDLCVRKSGITLAEIRRLHAFRYTTVFPVLNLVDHCSPPSPPELGWMLELWCGGHSDPSTVTCKPIRALYQYIIYGELFYSAFREVCWPLGPNASAPVLDLDTRLTYIKYCIPDLWCLRSYQGSSIKHKGPYAKGRHSFDDRSIPYSDQYAIGFFLSSTKWKQEWRAVYEMHEPEMSSLKVGDWRYDLWCSMVMTQGLEGLEMLLPGGVEKWKTWLLAISKHVASLEDKFRPQEHTFGRHELIASDAPDMLKEISVCVEDSRRHLARYSNVHNA